MALPAFKVANVTEKVLPKKVLPAKRAHVIRLTEKMFKQKGQPIKYAIIDRTQTDTKYKYLLLDEEVRYQTTITGHGYTSKFLILRPDGMLIIKAGYAWDGPSGPTIDTPSFMRGSLIHDALYQLIRDCFSSAWKKSLRKYADEVIRDVCREDGMSWIRSRWVYYALRGFGWVAC